MIKTGKKILKLLCLFLTLSIAGITYLYFSIIPIEKIVQLKRGYLSIDIKNHVAKYTLTSKKPNRWVSTKKINKLAVNAIVTSEDWSFYQHSGFDINQIKESIARYLLQEKKLRGASTLTQQVAKNVFLSQEKTLKRKFQELLISLQIEKILTKNRILEIYLNVVEFGENIYGIKEAAEHYFKKRPQHLTAKEGAFLAMLLPSPRRYAQSFKKKSLTRYAKKTVDEILLKMVQAKYLTKRESEIAIKSRFVWEKVTNAQLLPDETLWMFDE